MRQAVSGTIDNLLVKAFQWLERSSEELVQQATTQETLVEALRLLQGLEPEKTAAIDNLLLAIQCKFVSSRIHEVVCLVQATMVFRYPTF